MAINIEKGATVTVGIGRSRTVDIEKEWDGNERMREAGNGRVYRSQGRWQWLVVVDGVVESEHDRKRDALARKADLEQAREQELLDAGVFIDPAGHHHAACALCKADGDRYTDCSTHPDAANGLDFCGDCGRATCPDHRTADDAAGRCIDCTAARKARVQLAAQLAALDARALLATRVLELHAKPYDADDCDADNEAFVDAALALARAVLKGGR